MSKTKKKVVAFLVIALMIAAFIPFKVFANDAYKITFSINNNAVGYHDADTDTDVPHSMEVEGNRLKIDGQYVEPRLASNPDAEFTGYTLSQNGSNVEMTITNGEEVILSFNSAEKFELFANGNSFGANKTFSGENQVAIQDVQHNNPVNPQNPDNPNNPGGTEGTYNINFGTATYDVAGVNVTATVEGKTINNSQPIEIGENEVITLTGFNPDTMEVRVTEDAPNPFGTTLRVDNNGGVFTTKIANHTNNGGVPNDLIFVVQPLGNDPEDDDPHIFDGNAYFVWINNNGKVCYHKFTHLDGAIPTLSGMYYKMNYINAADITDESGNNSDYVWGLKYANWVLPGELEDEEGHIIPERLNKLYIFGDGIPSTDRRKENGVQLDPCGGINGANSLCSNADRNFRVTIYRDGYQAVSFSDLQDEYTYFPEFWNPIFFSSTVDISGTTESNPAEYDTYLLEPTVKFSKGRFSEEVTAVEALNVNPDAVEITNNAGVFTVKFNSNYYDHVVFKVTAGGKDYFLKLNRMVIDVTDNFGPGVEDTKLRAELYYPTSMNYDDFEVIATVVNRDGTEETSVVSVNKYESEDYQNVIDRTVNDYVLKGGKGLYCSQYSVSVDQDKVAGAYFTVIKKGALKGDNYGGTFAGSGRGTYYDLALRKTIL